MKLRDISLSKRLLLGNFLMVFIPLSVMAIMGWLIFTAVRFLDTGQRSELLVKLWADKGSALAIQFAVTSIEDDADRHDTLKLKNLRKDCQILESQGIAVAVLQDGNVLYVTPDVNVEDIRRQIAERKILSPSMLWDAQGFAFRYFSGRHRAEIMAVGNVPLDAQKSNAAPSLKKILEVLGAIIFVGAVIFTILLGRYLSQLLSRQVLEPLRNLREVSEQIRAGNLDVALNVDANDEIGETCRAFDKMRRELKENKALREKYERNRKELLAGISHDLATPLTALKGYANGILDGIANTPDKKLHYVEMMSQTVADMEKLVESLFLFSKLDLGRVEFNLEPVRPADYFADFVADKKDLFLQRGLNLTFDGEKIDSLVKIDRLQFARLVNNLLDNSVKYKKNAVVNMAIGICAEDGHLRISFADDGRGVGRAELAKIFDIFYRTDPARSNTAKGSGLGLAVVKQIVLGMHGDIWAEETLGGGLTIVIRLPIYEERHDEKNLAD